MDWMSWILGYLLGGVIMAYHIDVSGYVDDRRWEVPTIIAIWPILFVGGIGLAIYQKIRS